MEFNLADLSRRLQNLIRLGTIAEVKYSRIPRVRVTVGEITTNWLPVVTAHAAKTKTWTPPDVDEQCLVFSPSGDLAAGVVLAGINSSHQQAPDDDPHNTRIVYPDGAQIDYNHQSHAFNVTLPDGGSAVIEAPASVTVRSAAITLDAPQTTCTGNLLVQKALTYMGGMSGQGSGTGAAAVIKGAVHATEHIQSDTDIVANGISLTGHTHREQGDGNNVSKPL